MSDDDDTYLSNRPANDNAFDPTALDARLLWHILELLFRARGVGVVERDLHDSVVALEGHATPAEVNTAIKDARRSGFVVLRGGLLFLERRVTTDQLTFVRELVRSLGARGRT